jgi:DNA-binding NarL/FixJ family response regulator
MGRQRSRERDAGRHVIPALIVEDDFRVARLHAEVVEALDGFTVAAVAHTASAALDAVRHRKPRLVLLDLYLPDANGLDVLHASARCTTRRTSSSSAPRVRCRACEPPCSAVRCTT